MHGGTVIIPVLAPPFLNVTVNVFASPGFATLPLNQCVGYWCQRTHAHSHIFSQAHTSGTELHGATFSHCCVYEATRYCSVQHFVVRKAMRVF